MSVQFFLSDLPRHNLMPNGNMRTNEGWRTFLTAITCYYAQNPYGGHSLYVGKGAFTGTCGVRSGAFSLIAGQSYILALHILLQDTVLRPKICIYGTDNSLLLSSASYKESHKGWLMAQISFTAVQTSSEAFIALMYENTDKGNFFLDNVMLYPANAAVASIEIKPEWSLDMGLATSNSKTRSLAGSLFIYDWHHYAKISIALDFVPAATAAKINSFWLNRTSLLYTMLQDNTLQEYIQGVLTDNSTPLSQYQQPYTNYYRGRLTFEAL